MANTIKLKTGSGSDPSASDLIVGELAIRTDSGKIFTKKDNGSVAEISGGGGISDGDKGDITVSNGGDTFTIDDGAVTEDKIGSLAIVSTKLAPDAVTDAKLSDSASNDSLRAVGTNHIKDGAVNNAKVASNASIQGSKISPDFGSQNVVTTGTLGSGDITISDNSPKLTFTDGDQDPDYEILVDGGAFAIRSGGSNRIRVKSDHNVDITGNLDVGSGVDVTGNITVTGTVDGRDLATDGSKLDGIDAGATNVTNNNQISNGAGYLTDVSTSDINNEAVTTAKMQHIAQNTVLGRTASGTGDVETLNASDIRGLINVENGATGDQSANEILTAIKTVDGSGSGLDSDLLDGQEGSYYRNASNINAGTISDARLPSSISSDITGNSATATKLANARTIAGVSFDGSANISLNNNAITNGAGYITATLTNEQVQDIVGGMVSGNSESGITVTYQDSDGTLDFSVASQTDQNFTTTLKNKLDGIAAGATNVTNNNQLTNGAGYITSSSIPTVTGAAKKFVNFDGTNNSIRNDLGVSSISDHGAGQYTVNFDGNFDNTNYTITHGIYRGSGKVLYHFDIDNSITTSSHRFMISAANNVGNVGLVARDTDQLHLAFFLN